MEVVHGSDKSRLPRSTRVQSSLSRKGTVPRGHFVPADPAVRDQIVSKFLKHPRKVSVKKCLLVYVADVRMLRIFCRSGQERFSRSFQLWNLCGFPAPKARCPRPIPLIVFETLPYSIDRTSGFCSLLAPECSRSSLLDLLRNPRHRFTMANYGCFFSSSEPF